MSQAELLRQCLEVAKQLTDKNENAIMDIKIGGFSFVFDNKEIPNSRKKSPSQLSRDLKIKNEFKFKVDEAKHQAKANPDSLANKEVQTEEKEELASL